MDFIIDSYMFTLLNLPKPRLGVREATNYKLFNSSSHHLFRGMNFWPHFSPGGGGGRVTQGGSRGFWDGGEGC